MIAIRAGSRSIISRGIRHLHSVRIRSVVYLYLLAIVLSETITSFVHPVVGVALHLAIFGSLIVRYTRTPESDLLLSLSLIPLIRIVSLGAPLSAFDETWWFILTGIPLLAATLIVIRALSLSRLEVGVRLPHGLLSWAVTIAVVASGMLIGAVERSLLDAPNFVSGRSTTELMIFAGALVISTGLTEELIFRGVLQFAAINLLGIRRGILFVSILFAAMQMGHRSIEHVGLVFGIALYFGYIRHRTGSLLGVVAAHSIANILFFVVLA